jgi:hypothetical protein
MNNMEEKESYCVRIEERLRDLGGQLDEMMWKAQNFARKTRRKFKRSAEKFRESKETVSGKISEIRNASGKSWKDLTQGLEKGMNELEKGFENAVQEFKQGEAGGSGKKPSKQRG